MSAFLIDVKHINMIITWAIDNGTLGKLSPQAWLNEFHAENIRSLNYRYPDDNQQIITSWKYLPNFNAIKPRKYSKEIAIAIVKLINCWEYQCCEDNYDKNSLPWKMMSQIKDLALHKAGYRDLDRDNHEVYNSTLYDRAPWVYDIQAWKKYLNYLPTASSETQLTAKN